MKLSLGEKEGGKEKYEQATFDETEVLVLSRYNYTSKHYYYYYNCYC